MQKSLVLATVCPTRLHDSKFTVISGGHRAGAKFIWVGGESERRDENIYIRNRPFTWGCQGNVKKE